MRPDKIYNVKFDGYVEKKEINGHTVYDYKDYKEIEAVPYDMMVSGGDSQAISVLRLWKSQNMNMAPRPLYSVFLAWINSMIQAAF